MLILLTSLLANRLLLDKEKGKYLPCYMVATIYRAFSTNKVETKNISYKKLSRLTEEKNLSNLQFPPARGDARVHARAPRGGFC